MSEKKLQELLSIISEGQDSEQRRKLYNYIRKLRKENYELKNELSIQKVLGIEKEKTIENRTNRIVKAQKYIKTKYIAQGGLTSYEVNDLLNEILEILDKGE